MTASPAADWIPVVDGKRPDLPDGTRIDVRCIDGFETRSGMQINCVSWPGPGPNQVIAYRLAPAQYAEGECVVMGVDFGADESHTVRATFVAGQVTHVEYSSDWHPTSILPAEGRVVELRFTGDAKGRLCMHKYGKFSYECDHSDFNSAVNEFLHNYEWRYPPSERAEATINAGPELSNGRGNGHASEADKSPSVAPVPAPQRQNLALWLALRGRAPWPESKRDTLPALPLTSWRNWK